MPEPRADGAVIAAKARELLNPPVPFRPYGRTLTGIDCIGVVMWVAAQLGIWPVFRRDTEHALPKYSFPPQPELFDEIFPQYADEVPVDEMAEGDIVIFINERGTPQHTAIAVKPLKGKAPLELVGILLDPSRRRMGEFELTAHLRSQIYKVYRYRNVI